MTRLIYHIRNSFVYKSFTIFTGSVTAQ